MASGKITKTMVDQLRIDPDRDCYLWDSGIAGFGVKLTPKGARTYLFQYRDRSKRTRRITIGRHGSVTAQQARDEAEKLAARVRLGEDPAQINTAARSSLSVAEGFSRFFEEMGGRRKASSVAEYKRLFEKHIAPGIGRLLIKDVERSDIAQLHHAMRATPYQANRVLAVTGSFFTWAARRGLRPDSNPSRLVEKYKEEKKERFLSPIELTRLGAVLSASEPGNPIAVNAIRLLLLTGMRKNEALTLKWDYVDQAAGLIRLPDSKTGAKTIPLAAPASDILQVMERIKIEDNPYIFYGKKRGGHLIGLQKVWERIRRDAELTDVRIHDLRHSFASVGASGGDSLVILGAILGHADTSTTQRYAHLHDDPRLAAAERIAGQISANLNGVEGDVVPFRSPA